MAFISLSQKLSGTSPCYSVKVVLKFVLFPISSPFSSTEELIKKNFGGKMKFRSLQSEDPVLIHYINHPHWWSQLQCAQCLRELHRGCYAFSFSNYRTSCSWEFVDDKRAFKKCVCNVVKSLERLSKCWWKNTVHCRWWWTWEEFYWLPILFHKKLMLSSVLLDIQLR